MCMRAGKHEIEIYKAAERAAKEYAALNGKEKFIIYVPKGMEMIRNQWRPHC